MASVNKWIGIGNLGRDPETRAMPNGDMLCNITIACTDTWRDRVSGEKKEQTEWVRIQFFGKLAEIAGQYLKKGSQVYIEGSLRTREYEKDGIKRYVTEIRADEMKMLGSRQSGGNDGGDYEPTRQAPRQQQRAPAPTRAAPRQGGQRQPEFPDEEIPFAPAPRRAWAAM